MRVITTAPATCSGALLAALLNGFDLADSTKVAVDFTVESIRKTKAAGTDVRFGVNFECTLPRLSKALTC